MPEEQRDNPAGHHIKASNAALISSSVEDLLVSATERGVESFRTGRFICTYKPNAAEHGHAHLKSQGLHIADARDFEEQRVTMEHLEGADALYFPEIGVALLSEEAHKERERRFRPQVESEMDSPVEAIEPEYFVFSQISEFLHGFLCATETIARELAREEKDYLGQAVDAQTLGATWGLNECKVPLSSQSGKRIKVAILDTGMDLSHPDYTGRPIPAQTFVGEPVQDLHGHGTHTTGTACGPKTPPGSTPRYGIAFDARIFSGKVLTNSGNGTTSTLLAGMNWAIANRCEIISMSLGAQTPVQAAYTAAGNAALSKGCLMIAAAGNYATTTGAPANSPSIMSVAALDANRMPSSFSNFGKIEIAGPGRDVFSTFPMPRRYATMSGTSMATPHVAGCAALWAQTSSSFRGMNLWTQLQTAAQRLPLSATKVGAGLVQAP